MIRTLVEAAALVDAIQARTKDLALKELLAAAGSACGWSPATLKALGKRLAEREAIGSTGLGNGIAVPHVKGDKVERVMLVVGRSREGVEWQAIDGRPVHIAFLLVSPADEPETHLKCLRWIATLARSADFRRFLMDAAGPPGMRDLLVEMAVKE